MDGELAFGILVGGLISSLLSAPFGAIFLRAGIALNNHFTQPSGTVPEPRFMRAILIAFVSTFVTVIVGSVLDALLVSASPNFDTQGLIANLISLPVGFCVMAYLLRQMLPTSFGRACVITLCTYAAAIAICAAIAVVGMLVISVLS